MNYLVSILKEMNEAATGQDERRSKMSIHNQPPKGRGAASEPDEGRLEAKAHVAPAAGGSEDAGADPPKEQILQEADAGDIDPSPRAFFELDPPTGENAEPLPRRIESTEFVRSGLGLCFGGEYGKSFYGSVNKEGLEKALERLEKTPIPPALNTLADQMRRGKRRR